MTDFLLKAFTLASLWLIVPVTKCNPGTMENIFIHQPQYYVHYMNSMKGENFMRFILICALLSMNSCMAVFSPKARMSPEIRFVVRSLKTRHNELDISHLQQTDKRKIIDLRRNKTLEVYDLPVEPGTIDAFGYKIYYDSARGEFWVSRYGGFAGNTNIYGPTKISMLKKRASAVVRQTKS